MLMNGIIRDFNHIYRTQYTFDAVARNISSSFEKLQRGIYDPTSYTENEICVLNIILFHKNSMLDCSFWDLHTEYGLERFADALSLQKHGYEYYLYICKKEEESKNVG